MDSNDVRFPWEDPDEAPAARERPLDDMASPPLAGAPHAEAVDAEAAPADDEPWSQFAADAATGSSDLEPWAAPAAAAAPAAGAPADTGTSARERPIAHKEYYSISEVCDLVDLKPHVLRYWETQFAVLNPSKNRSGNRVYQRKEIKLIQLVKNLLYDEKYTVEGAKQKLEQMRRGGALPAATARALDGQTIDMLRTELRRLSELLTPPEPG
jgi:DNA-binding transcriptional MerR regulator